jgi:predicted Zn-dependent protease
MARVFRLILTLVPLTTAGCLSPFGGLEKSTVSLVPANLVNTPVATPKVSYAPAAAEVAMKVDYVGQKILAANPEAKVKPLFATIGANQSEVFHQGEKMVYITEGLVKKCKSEGQLAAVLSEELAAMEAERRTLARGRPRDAEQRTPIDVPIGNAGQFNSPDLTHLAELSRADKARAQSAPRPAPIDPHALALNFLRNARYDDGDLQAAQPLLKEAEANWSLEKTVNGSAAISSH